MNDRWSDQHISKITAAKELLLRSLDSIKDIPNLEIALRVYGHQYIVTPTYQNCEDTKLEVPFGPNNFNAIRAKVNRIQAKGTTPIARSLEAAADDFPDKNSKNVIILITDGLEACDGDPCVIAQKLKSKEIHVTPFVIGLDMDLSYLEKFKCIGETSAAESPYQFTLALSNVLHKVINNCTAEIDLNDIYEKPTETNVSVYMYKAGTNELKYSFIHTLNEKGNPDTLKLDPSVKYDIEVATIPPVFKKNVTVFRNMHNIIPVNTPQGMLRITSPGANKSFMTQTRVADVSNKTLNVQALNATDKYIVGKYKIEILTLPRIYKDVTISQSQTTTITIPAPGHIVYRFIYPTVAQLFVLDDNNHWQWVVNLDENSQSGLLELLPGNYRITYRYKKNQKTEFSSYKEFSINSNKSISLIM